MGDIWLIGFLAIIVYRVFYAGMHTKQAFYRKSEWSWEDKDKLYFCEKKTIKYAFITFWTAFTWPIAAPLYGVYKLGKRYSKEN